ncbi:MAG TPA: type II secretion system protein M [Steroidobacteraceae bacterium]|jgi:general secretion pathway protein M|nr:type II secretion system protein M [Steroidobacteraceae bacterium]
MTLDSLRSRYDQMTPREQRLVLAGGVVAVVLLLFAVILPLHRSAATLDSRIERKKADLAWMQGIAPALAAAGPAPSVPGSQESLLVVIDRSARESGLAQALTGSQPSGDGALRVQLEKAEFNNLVAWLARLATQNGVQVETASIDATGEPGQVNAGIVLRSR